MSVNRVTLLGNVGKTPEIRDGAGGAKFATFSLATTDRGYTKRDGTQVPERTEWHNIVANGSIVQVIERYVTAGTKLYIEGKLRTRKYTARDNTEKYVTEIVVDTFEMLSSKKEASNPAVPFENQVRYQQNPQNWSGNDNTTQDVPF